MDTYTIYLEWFDKEFYLVQLGNELTAADLHWWEPYWDVGGDEEALHLRIGYPSTEPESTPDAITAVVEAHVPVFPPPPPTPGEIAATIRGYTAWTDLQEYIARQAENGFLGP